MSEHTKGPWHIGPETVLRPTMTIYSRPFGLGDICEVYPKGEEGKANARLISAAPELLEALEEVVAEATAYEARHGEMRRPWVRKARAAIAKAKGES